MRTGDGWSTPDLVYGLWWHADVMVTDVRPLAVLDLLRPERLVRYLRDHSSDRVGGDSMDALMQSAADQIEAQTSKKIPEPADLLTVVESDSAAASWVRTGEDCWTQLGGPCCSWSDLPDDVWVVTR